MLANERDITDKNLDAREDMLTLVAHDVRGMLNTILVSASTILMFPDMKDDVASSAASIQRVSGDMAQLLEDLIDFSKFESGELRLTLAAIDIGELVRDALEIHEPVARTRGITVALHPYPGPVTLRADGKRLTRVFMNLISNALKFTPQGGHIEITVAIVDGECEIAVRDNGIGIPQDQLETIFERFQQVGIHPRRSFGAGLGLYIARMITRAHNGRVWAESSPGAGSTFRVRLPLTP